MATILCIDTSTDVCSVALTSDGMILMHREDFTGRNHASLLSGFIKDALDHVADHEMTLNAVAVSMGPGSYTGLRIGLSEAKGLAYAKSIPLIGVDTLQLLTVDVMFNHEPADDAIFVPMIDARRMEVYTGAFDMALDTLMAEGPLILDETGYADLLSTGREVIFFGNGSGKFRALVKAPNARFIDSVVPLASNMLALAERAWLSRQFSDLAYSTPNYLKEFQATKPKPLC